MLLQANMWSLNQAMTKWSSSHKILMTQKRSKNENDSSHACTTALAYRLIAIQLSALVVFSHSIIMHWRVTDLIHEPEHPSSVSGHNMVKGSDSQTYKDLLNCFII